jgi:hypothetical protein
MTEQERLQAEIAAARAELAETADALAAKLDVKAQAGQRIQAAGEKLTDRLAHLHDAAPAPVQKALEQTGHVMSPALARARADKRIVLAVLAGTMAAVLVARRLRR